MKKAIFRSIILFSVLILPMANSQTASARILFEDDAYFNVNSEGIILDANNNAGTNPINLQFGNDGTDANIGYDTVTQNITFSSPANIIFDDAQLIGTIQLSDSATDWNGTFSTDGIVDNINSFTSTSNGQGASNVGVEDASNWFTGTEIESALNEIEALFGSTSSNIFNFTENNVLIDNDPVYTALNRLDLKWGDLASTANGEGASLVGIEDAGGYFSGTNVEAALQELGTSSGANFSNLTFFPEYPDTTVYPDGSNNQGTLESFYDDVQQTGYYEWTTNALIGTQDMDLRFSFPLPNDFSSTGDFTYDYRTGTTTEANNDVEVRLYNLTDSQECANDLTNGTANTWATGTITAASIDTGCTGGTTLNAGDIVEVQIKLLDQLGASDFANSGKLIWNYLK